MSGATTTDTEAAEIQTLTGDVASLEALLNQVLPIVQAIPGQISAAIVQAQTAGATTQHLKSITDLHTRIQADIHSVSNVLSHHAAQLTAAAGGTTVTGAASVPGAVSGGTTAAATPVATPAVATPPVAGVVAAATASTVSGAAT